MNSTVKPHKRMTRGGQDGMVLVASLLLLGILAVMIASLFTVTKPELISTALHKNQLKALYEAEAGVRHVMHAVNEDLKAGTIELTNEVEIVDYRPKVGFGYGPVNQIIRLPDDSASIFIITGKYQNSTVVIEASIERPQLMQNAGVFGNNHLKVQPYGNTYSYNSTELAFPTPADSTGMANMGSNVEIDFRSGVYIDGEVLLGEDPATGTSPTPPAGYDSIETGFIEPDPMGASGGFLDDCFELYSDSANNDNGTCAYIKANRLSCKPGDIFTMNTGNYYLTDISIGANAVVNFDTSAGPVVFYLDGELKTQPGCMFNVTNGIPSEFFIFSRSTDPINIQPNGDFAAFVYAPYADIAIKPNNNARGVFWGNTVDLQPGNDLFIDVALLDEFRSYQVELTQWRNTGYQ